MEFRLPGVPPADLVDLYRKRALTEREYKLAIEWATKPPERERWSAYLRDWFLVFGVLLLVAGVIVFGAYNWQALSRFQKLGLLEVLTAGAWLASWLRGLDSKEGTVLLWGASLLVGAFLAVFGQIYQTGADAYTLFAGWALLITPWCLAGRSNLIWLTQAVLVNTAFTLFWFQASSDPWGLGHFALVHASLNFALAAGWQLARRRYRWMSFGLTDALFASALTPLTMASCTFVWEVNDTAACLAVTLVALLALVKLFGSRIRTMAIVGCCVLSVCGSWTIRVLIDAHEIGFLAIAIALVIELTLVVRWLQRVNAANTPVEPGPAETLQPSVMEVLAANGLLEGEADSRRVGQGAPVYVSCLTALGAWISSWFFLFFVILGANDSAGVLTIMGLFLWVGTLLARRRVKSDFLISLCLAVNLAAQLITLYGFGEWGDHGTLSLSALALTLQAFSLFCYKDSIGRGLYAFASVISGGLLFHEIGGSGGLSLWLLGVAFLVSRLFIGQRGWLLSRWRYWYGAVALGWTCGLLTLLGFWGFDLDWIWYWNEMATIPVALGMTALVSACAVRLQAPLSAILALIVLGVVTFPVPGLMAAMLVFILGYHTRSPNTTRLAVIFLLVFGVRYYYSLDLDFLAKSLTLIGSGLIFLMARSSLRAHPVRHAF